MWKLWAFIFIYPHSELLDIVCSWSRCSIAMLILHSANTTCLPEIQEGSIKMRGSEWLWRAGEWQVLFEHVSKKSCWNANLMKQQGCLYWEVEIKKNSFNELCYECDEKVSSKVRWNKDQKLPQIPHTAKSCILLGKISVFCVPARYNVKRTVLHSYMQNFSSRRDLNTDLWSRTGVIP